MSINRYTCVGNLCRDPELRGLQSGGNVCSMRIAVNERRKDSSGQWVDAPNFLNVTVFGNSADACAKHLSKGSQVAVDGRLRWREWQDQQGNKRESIEIVANDVQFLGGRDGGGQSQGSGHDGGQGAWGGQGDFGGPPVQNQQPAPGTTYPVHQGDFGGAPQQGQQAAMGANWGTAPTAQTGPADDDIPF